MKKIAGFVLTAVMLFTTFAFFGNAEDVGKTVIPYITVTCENAPGETFKEITFAGRQWIVLNEDADRQTALMLMKDNYASGSYGQSSDNNAAVLYNGSKIDRAMNAFYSSLSDEDKNLIAPTSFPESVVINKRDGKGKPALYLEAGDNRIDEAVTAYKLQGVVITATENNDPMERYVFAPSAKDIMDLGLEKAASTEQGGLLEYTALGDTPFENASLSEIFSDDASLSDYSSVIFFTRSADTTRTGHVYTPCSDGIWDYYHGKSLRAGIRPALNLDLTKVRLEEKADASADNPVMETGDGKSGSQSGDAIAVKTDDNITDSHTHDFSGGDCICGEPAPTSSTLSEGNSWIIGIIAVLAVGAVVALIIIKKKPAAAGGENKDEE